MKLFLDVIQFLYNLMQQLPHIENVYHLHFASKSKIKSLSLTDVSKLS